MLTNRRRRSARQRSRRSSKKPASEKAELVGDAAGAPLDEVSPTIASRASLGDLRGFPGDDTNRVLPERCAQPSWEPERGASYGFPGESWKRWRTERGLTQSSLPPGCTWRRHGRVEVETGGGSPNPTRRRPSRACSTSVDDLSYIVFATSRAVAALTSFQIYKGRVEGGGRRTTSSYIVFATSRSGCAFTFLFKYGIKGE